MTMADGKIDFRLFMPIGKVDKVKRTVSGYASTPTKDSDGEIVSLDAIRAALPDYMQYGNIREMHKLSAVGVAQEANVDTKGLFLTAKIVDDAAWKKCLEGVYKGFSIGGRKLDKEGDEITAVELLEVSVVDRPANPDCRISLAKSMKTLGDAPGYLIKMKSKPSTEAQALVKMAKIVEKLAKAGPPAAHDGFSLPAEVKKELSPNDARANENETRKTDGPVPCEAHGKVDCEECKTAKGADAPGDGSKPYGDVEYADNGIREDGKKRYPIDTEEHIRAAWNYINKPKNAAKYGEKASSVKAKIIAAWKAKIDKDGPPSAAKKSDKTAKKLAKMQLLAALGLETPSFLTLSKVQSISSSGSAKEAAPVIETLKKGMGTAGSLSYVFDSIRQAQRNLILEGKREGGDSKDKDLAKELGAIAKQLAAIISQKAEHEGNEALTLTDADDQYVLSTLGEDYKMAAIKNGDGQEDTTIAKTGDALADAVALLMKRAAVPTRAQRVAQADDNCAKARKACKMARAAIEEAHKMHKAAYLSKMAKAKKTKPDSDSAEDEFDHAGAMEKLQKAYQEIDKARMFGKAAREQLAKASARSGQRGQEVGDAEAGFYEVPAGVKDLSIGALSGASPGGEGSSGQPPMYPTDGAVYPGKSASATDLRKYVKNGQIPADVVELVLENAKAQGELEALRRLPATPTGGRRPYAFDVSKVTGGGSSNDAQDLNKALFDGVDINALSSGDERAHTEASARAIGNFLTSGRFGKSVFDPNFKGAAGGGH